MTKHEKLRKKLRNSPQSGTIEDVKTLLYRFNFRLDRVSGSHHIFVYHEKELFHSITVPAHGNKVRKVYIEHVIQLLDELFPESDTEEE